MDAELGHQLPRVVEACRRWGVRRLWLFGSARTGSTRPADQDSDLDLLVEFERSAQDVGGFRDPYWQFLIELDALFRRRVDLVELRPFRDAGFARELERTREILYDRSPVAF
jgi:predicted nucleotidyltransferase